MIDIVRRFKTIVRRGKVGFRLKILFSIIIRIEMSKIAT